MRGSRGKFLVVEDNDRLARAIARVIDGVHPGTLVATSAEAARSILDSEQPLVGMVTDVGLADGDGLDVAQHARARRSALPIVVLTGRIRGDWKERAAELGVRALVKPIAGSELLPFVCRALLVDLDALSIAIEIARHAGEAEALRSEEIELLVRAVMGRDDLWNLPAEDRPSSGPNATVSERFAALCSERSILRMLSLALERARGLAVPI